MKVNFLILSITCAILLHISLISCDNPPIKPSRIWKCHINKGLDSIETQNSIIGIWEWDYIDCFWAPDEANSTEFEGLNIEFHPNKTLRIEENGQTIETTNWKLKRVNQNVYDEELYSLVMDSSVSQLHGYILFCNDIVQFRSSDSDGCDNYFSKVK